MFLLEQNVYYERLFAVKNQRSLENKETVGFILENGEETGSRYFSDLSKGNTMYLAGTIELVIDVVMMQHQLLSYYHETSISNSIQSIS